MNKNIGIIAPMFEESRAQRNYLLRLKKDNRELTLKALHELCSNSYNVDKVLSGLAQEETLIPGSGYYLTGLLRAKGYNTTLAYLVDEKSLRPIVEADPMAVCISTSLIWTLESLEKIVNEVRRLLPGTKIILGGTFVWKSYQWDLLVQKDPGMTSNEYYSMDKKYFMFQCDKSEIDTDIIVASPHGGNILLDILKELSRGSKADFQSIPNLALPNEKGKFVFTKRIDEKIDYNNDYTRWDLVDELKDPIPIRTSIGCPYRCGFCDFCTLYPKIFLRSTESLKTELKMVHARGARMIYAADDNTFFSSKRINEICSAFIDSGTGLLWLGLLRASSINPYSIALIKESGLIHSNIGLESGDQGQLDNMNKRLNLEEARTGIETLDHAGIAMLLNMVVGFPGETEQTVENTGNFLNSLDITFSLCGFFIYRLNVFPMSQISLMENRKKWDLYGLMDQWSHRTMNSEQALTQCFKLFKQVTNIPYNYLNDLDYFIVSLGAEKRRKLFRLRHQLTLSLMEQKPWGNTAQIFADICETFKLPPAFPPVDLKDQLIIPRIDE